MYWVYVLRNNKGILYKGLTSNLNNRIRKHSTIDGFNSYTQKRGPWSLIYTETFEIESEARKREKFFKSGKGRDYLKTKLGDYPPRRTGKSGPT